MAEYDYVEGKKRILEILNQSDDNTFEKNVPNDDEFHFDNGYYCYVTSIFVDIRDSTELFGGGKSATKRSTVSKIIRCFTSEVIEILNKGNKVREIGIRGDCVYGVFSTPMKNDIYDVMDKAVYINTLIKMLNALFTRVNIKPLKIGIGVATSRDLVVKAGRKGSGINGKVWIGEAVTNASNLSSYGNKSRYTDNPIVISSITHDNIFNLYLNDNPESIEWFTERTFDGKRAYTCDIIKIDMNNWISNGMKNQ